MTKGRTKGKLWLRVLECGHTRLTSVAYLNNIYKKPPINSPCYCLECMIDTKVIGVTEYKPKTLLDYPLIH